MLLLLLRTLLLYAVLLVGERLMGKRQIGQLQTSELVSTLLLSELAVLPIQNGGDPLWRGLLPMGALILCEVGVSLWMLKSGRWQAGNITVANRTEAALRPFAELGAHTTTDNVAAATGADVVFVVVKPWVVEGVLAEIKGSLDLSAQTVVVIAAGVGSADMARWLADSGGRTPALMLAMPNIAVAELCSMTFVVPVKATRQQTESVCAVLGP